VAGVGGGSRRGGGGGCGGGCGVGGGVEAFEGGGDDGVGVDASHHVAAGGLVFVGDAGGRWVGLDDVVFVTVGADAVDACGAEESEEWAVEADGDVKGGGVVGEHESAEFDERHELGDGGAADEIDETGLGFEGGEDGVALRSLVVGGDDGEAFEEGGAAPALVEESAGDGGEAFGGPAFAGPAGGRGEDGEGGRRFGVRVAWKFVVGRQEAEGGGVIVGVGVEAEGGERVGGGRGGRGDRGGGGGEGGGGGVGEGVHDVDGVCVGGGVCSVCVEDCGALACGCVAESDGCAGEAGEEGGAEEALGVEDEVVGRRRRGVVGMRSGGFGWCWFVVEACGAVAEAADELEEFAAGGFVSEEALEAELAAWEGDDGVDVGVMADSVLEAGLDEPIEAGVGEGAFESDGDADGSADVAERAGADEEDALDVAGGRRHVVATVAAAQGGDGWGRGSRGVRRGSLGGW